MKLVEVLYYRFCNGNFLLERLVTRGENHANKADSVPGQMTTRVLSVVHALESALAISFAAGTRRTTKRSHCLFRRAALQLRQHFDAADYYVTTLSVTC